MVLSLFSIFVKKLLSQDSSYIYAKRTFRLHSGHREMHKGVGSLRAIPYTNLCMYVSPGCHFWRSKRLYLDDLSAGSILAVMLV